MHVMAHHTLICSPCTLALGRPSCGMLNMRTTRKSWCAPCLPPRASLPDGAPSHHRLRPPLRLPTLWQEELKGWFSSEAERGLQFAIKEQVKSAGKNGGSHLVPFFILLDQWEEANQFQLMFSRRG
jgi:hypothetical protein